MALVRAELSGTVTAVHVTGMQDVNADTKIFTVQTPDCQSVDIPMGFKGVVNEVRVKVGDEIRPGQPLAMVTKFDANPVV